MTKQKQKSLEVAKVLAANPKVDKNLVENFTKLEQELQSIGVSTRTRYSLSSPLGDGPVQCFYGADREQS